MELSPSLYSSVVWMVSPHPHPPTPPPQHLRPYTSDAFSLPCPSQSPDSKAQGTSDPIPYQNFSRCHCPVPSPDESSREAWGSCSRLMHRGKPCQEKCYRRVATLLWNTSKVSSTSHLPSPKMVPKEPEDRDGGWLSGRVKTKELRSHWYKGNFLKGILPPPKKMESRLGALERT